MQFTDKLKTKIFTIYDLGFMIELLIVDLRFSIMKIDFILSRKSKIKSKIVNCKS